MDNIEREFTKMIKEYRAIILLWLENMTYEDIAGIMGISLANVTTRLFRIKEQLKQMSNA